MYLTPERVKTMGLGIDLDGFDTIAIRASIARATSSIDTFCAVPTIPQRYSFRGGSIANEEHTWPIDPWQRPRPLQIWPWHTPVRTVTDCRLIWGVQNNKEFFLAVDPTNILIADIGYIEISSLNLSQLVFGDAVMPYIGLHNPVSRISYTYGYRFVVTDEFGEPVDARTYQMDNQFWADDPVEVKVNGVVRTEADYTLNRREGWVVFTANLNPDDEVTVSYVHTLPFDIAQACGLLVARDLSLADLRSKGMEGLASIKVKDVELRRLPPARLSGVISDMPDEAARLLGGWVFQSIR